MKIFHFARNQISCEHPLRRRWPFHPLIADVIREVVIRWEEVVIRWEKYFKNTRQYRELY